MSPDRKPTFKERRDFLGKAAKAFGGLLLAACSGSVQPQAEPVKPTGTLPNPGIVETPPVAVTAENPKATITVPPEKTYEPKDLDNRGMFPDIDTYPLFPEYDPKLTDMSFKGLQERLDQSVTDNKLTSIGKQGVLDKIDEQTAGVVYLQYKQEVGARMFTDAKNQLDEMLAYAKDKKYELIYSWNGETGDKFQTVVTLTRINENGEKQIWWNGTKNGALYLRPDSFDSYDTSSGFWITIPASPVIQWNDNNTPTVFSEKTEGASLYWFNPLAKSLLLNSYKGEWQAVLDAKSVEKLQGLLTEAGENYKLVRNADGFLIIQHQTKDAQGNVINSEAVRISQDGKDMTFNWLDNSSGKIISTPLINSNFNNLTRDINEATIKIKDNEKRYVYYPKLNGWIEADQVIPGGMSEWTIPVTDEIVEKMRNSVDLPQKFEQYLSSNSAFEGFIGFKAMMGKKYDESFDIITKDGRKISTALAYAVAYYFNSDGNPKAIIVPLAHKLDDNRVVINNNMLFLPWGDGGWEEVKLNNKERYDSVFNFKGQITTLFVPIEIQREAYTPDSLNTNAVLAFWNFVEFPYIDAWKPELSGVLTTGDNSQLQVIIDFKAH